MLRSGVTGSICSRPAFLAQDKSLSPEFFGDAALHNVKARRLEQTSSARAGLGRLRIKVINALSLEIFSSASLCQADLVLEGPLAFMKNSSPSPVLTRTPEGRLYGAFL